jgi:rod shape-determining protein MreB
MLKKIYQRFSNDIGIDLGTANSLVYLKGHGVILSEPSIVAINEKTGQIVAVGRQAKEMWGKTPSHISVVRPLIEGVVSDFEVTEEMLAYFLKKAEGVSKKFFRPRVVVGVPSGITNVETRAVYDAAINAGAREAYLVEEAMAAAIGARLPVLSSKATFIVDIGGGTTDIALIALGGIVRSLNLRVAGDHLNARIIDYLRDEFKLFVGEPTAEVAKLELASMQGDEYLELEVRGRDLVSGLPKGMVVTDTDIREALSFPLSLVLAGIREVLESAPPEMMGDVLIDGITLTGGGALLRGLPKLLETELKLPVKVSDDPLSAVARGTGIILQEFDKYKHVLLDINDYAATY